MRELVLKILPEINEIQDDLTSEVPIDYYKFKLKKHLPTQQQLIRLDPQVPTISASLGAFENTIDFSSANDSNLSYTSSLISTAAGGASLASRSGTEIFRATYASALTGNLEGTVTTPTSVGSPTVSGGYLVLKDGSHGLSFTGLTDFLNSQTGFSSLLNYYGMKK